MLRSCVGLLESIAVIASISEMKVKVLKSHMVIPFLLKRLGLLSAGSAKANSTS